VKKKKKSGSALSDTLKAEGEQERLMRNLRDRERKTNMPSGRATVTESRMAFGVCLLNNAGKRKQHKSRLADPNMFPFKHDEA